MRDHTEENEKGFAKRSFFEKCFRVELFNFTV